MTKLIFKINKKISILYSTFVFKLINNYFISVKKGVRFGSRVKINSASYGESTLRLFFDEYSYVKNDVIFQGRGKIHLGKRSFISSYCIIGSNESIYIGDDVMIADSVTIRDTDHRFDDLNIHMIKQGVVTDSIVINDNVWIGYGAVITKGLTIHSGSIIGANAVVTKDVPKNAIVAGVPAKIIRYRNEKD